MSNAWATRDLGMGTNGAEYVTIQNPSWLLSGRDRSVHYHMKVLLDFFLKGIFPHGFLWQILLSVSCNIYLLLTVPKKLLTLLLDSCDHHYYSGHYSRFSCKSRRKLVCSSVKKKQSVVGYENNFQRQKDEGKNQIRDISAHRKNGGRKSNSKGTLLNSLKCKSRGGGKWFQSCKILWL